MKTQLKRSNAAKRPRIGLALAGGAPLGIIYEIGALQALDEALEGIDFNHLHVYVGVSAGAAVAACLANQLTTAQLCHLIIGNAPGEQSLNPDIFLRPAVREYWQRLKSVPQLLLKATWEFIKSPFELGLLGAVTGGLSQALPTGVFDNKAIHQYLEQLFNEGGRTNAFATLQQKLYVVAVELDTGRPVIFGSKGYKHVPISKAVQASSALPGLYPPVKIDDRYYVDGALIKTLHASVALDEGVDLLLCLNPLVPFNAHLAAQTVALKHETLVEGGMPVVLSQTFRALIHSRLQVGMASYATHYENTDVVLFEPNRDDPQLFFVNPFSFANRYRVCEHAYQMTRQDLLARRHELAPVLERHGITLRIDRLEDKARHFSLGLEGDSAAEAHRLLTDEQQPITAQLCGSLNQLQSQVY